MQTIRIDAEDHLPATRDLTADTPKNLPTPKQVKLAPSQTGNENASLYFVGTATTIIEWAGIRIMTDPNFLHAGDHVHLGPGVSSQRRTNPAVGLHDLPRIDLILLSHYHEDHFDRKVEASLRRDLPIITTSHAHSQLTNKGTDSFTNISALDAFQSIMVDIGAHVIPGRCQLRITAMPGKHVPSNSVVESLNSIVHAIPPVNGWMLELGRDDGPASHDFVCGYRVYITGDTLMVDDLKRIPEVYRDKRIDLMLAHLGGTMIPSPTLAPLALMVTMDAKQGVELIRLIQPDLTVPIHYDDYDVFASSLEEFRTEVERAGLEGEVVYLDRGEKLRFTVKGEAR